MAYKTVMCPIEVPIGTYCRRKDRSICKYFGGLYEALGGSICRIFNKRPRYFREVIGFRKLVACLRLWQPTSPKKGML